MTPDPAGLAAVNPANPQSWNRYAYVLNAPTELTDPLGLCDISDASCLSPTVVSVPGVTNPAPLPPGSSAGFMPSSSGVCARTMPGGPQILAGRVPLGFPLNCPVPSPTPTLTPSPPVLAELQSLFNQLLKAYQTDPQNLRDYQALVASIFSYPSLNPMAGTEAEADYCVGFAYTQAPGLGRRCLSSLSLQASNGTISGLPGNGWGPLPGSSGGGWADRCWTSFTTACGGLSIDLPPADYSGGGSGGGQTLLCHKDLAGNFVCVPDKN
jgi:hypothetical protein